MDEKFGGLWWRATSCSGRTQPRIEKTEEDRWHKVGEIQRPRVRRGKIQSDRKTKT